MHRDCFADMLKAMIFKGAYIEITNRCNLDCRDCYNSSGRNICTVEIDPDVLIKYIEDLIFIYGAKEISFAGGEPLLHSQFDLILDRLTEISRRNPAVEFGFVTNGTLYNKKFYDLLENNKCFSVQISLDGPDEESCASMRGKGTFSKVIENVKTRKFINKPIYKMIINKTNASYVEEYFHFVYDEMGGLPSYAFATLMGNAVSNWREMNLTTEEKVKILKIIHKKYEDNNIKNIIIPMPTVSCDLINPDGNRDFCVKPDGSIQPCQNLYDKRFCIGNIYNIDWDSISANLKKITSYLAARLEIDYGCKKCFIDQMCGKGCPAFSFMRTSELLTSDGNCDFRRFSTIHLAKLTKILTKKDCCIDTKI